MSAATVNGPDNWIVIALERDSYGTPLNHVHERFSARATLPMLIVTPSENLTALHKCHAVTTPAREALYCQVLPTFALLCH